MTGERPVCPRTRGLIDRVVGERITVDDRRHAAACDSCASVLARAAKFDDELRRAAGALVTDELPRGVLDPGLSPTVVGVVAARAATPGLAGVLAAVVILIAATSVALGPSPLGPSSHDPNATGPDGSLPVATAPAPTPASTGLPLYSSVFRSTAEVGGDLIGLEYLCQSGRAREGVGPDDLVVRDGIVCYSPKSLTLTSVVIITGETQRGAVAEVVIKGQLVGSDTEAARSQLAETLAKATFLVIVDPGDAPRAGDFVLAHVPSLRLEAGGDAASGTFGDVQLTMQRRQDGSYLLQLRSIAPG